MTQSTAPTMSVSSGDMGLPGKKPSSRLAGRRSSKLARRRWLMLFAVVVLVVVAILANIGPLTHYQDARARLDKATAKVATLEAQKTDLQGQLAKLSETGYLETLAREQLTYVRPGEELYIVTNSPGASGGAAPATTGTAAAAGTATAIGAAPATGSEPVVTAGAGVGGDASKGATAAPDTTELESAATGPGESPGFLERALSAIRGLF